MTKKRVLLISIVVLIAAAVLNPWARASLIVFVPLVVALLYNLFALLIIGSFVALFAWYIFRILLPGVIRYRKLKQIRYYREINRRRRWDYEDD